MMAYMEIEIRRIAPGDATILRSVRLAALADTPSAFGSTHAAEVDRSDAEWSTRARSASSGTGRATFFATMDDLTVGIVGGYREANDPEVAVMVSMWTAPPARGSGAGRRLVRAVLDWAAASGSSSVELWVTQGNTAAQRLYESMGFAETGDHQPLPSDPCAEEVRMRRSVTGQRSWSSEPSG